jgi:Flp pilus assembly pilin Flp
MGDMKKRWLQFLRARDGMAVVEYALIAALLSVVAITSVRALGAKVNSHYEYLSNAIN